MSEFFVDPGGLAGLSGQLARASDDAYDTLDYTKRQCDLSWHAEGLLMMLIGPHERVYDEVTGSLTRLREVSRDAADQVRAAGADYARTDARTAALLDAAYPAAADAAGTRAALSQNGPGVRTLPASFADVAVPQRNLVAPRTAPDADMWSMNPLEDLASPAAWLRQVTIWVFGHDPFEGWVKQFSGDWAAYAHCGEALRQVGASAQDIGLNLVAGARDVGAVWQGNAADAEQSFQLTLGAAASGMRAACAACADLYAQAATATRALFDVVADLISNLLDVLIIINAAAAVGTLLVETGLGAVAGYGLALYYAGQAWQLYGEISRWYAAADDTIKSIGAAIDSMRSSLAVPSMPVLRPLK
jgi:uncharacterized protein YukE